MRSSTATIEMLGPRCLPGEVTRGSSAAIQLASCRLDPGVVGSVEQPDGRDGPNTHSAPAPSGLSREGGTFADVSVETAGAPPVDVAENAGLMHDVGNLMGALGLYADLLALPGVLNDAYREYAEDLRVLTERSSSLMTRLVACQRLHAPRETLTVLPEVVLGTKGLLRRIAGHEIEMYFGVGGDRPLQVPVEAVERILTNLVKNAGESMLPGSGAVTISVCGAGRLEEPRVVLSVTDRGRGMTAAQLGSLGQSSHLDDTGRGLGFRVVRELAAMSDGSVGVASEPGNGTTVSVEWRTVPQMTVEGHAATRMVTRDVVGWNAY